MSSASFFVSGTAALILPLLVGMPGAGGPVLVVGAPGSGTAGIVDIVARADGALLRETLVPWIALARSDSADFSVRLRHAGAWLVLDASAFGGCLGGRRT